MDDNRTSPQGRGWRSVLISTALESNYLTASITFVAALGFAAFSVATVGLLIGGVLAAPLGAWLVKRIPAKPLLVAVGILLTLTSLYGIYRALA